MAEFFKLFRGSVLEDVMIPYTLSGMLVVLSFLMVANAQGDRLAAKTLFLDGQLTTPLVALAVFWALSIAIGATLTAVAHFICDKLLRDLLLNPVAHKLDDKLNELRGQKTGKERIAEIAATMVAEDSASTYRLRYSKIYIWAQFDLGMSLAIPIVALFFQKFALLYLNIHVDGLQTCAFGNIWRECIRMVNHPWNKE